MPRETSIKGFIIPLLFIYLSVACTTSKITLLPSEKGTDIRDFNTYNFFDLEASGDTTAEFYQNMTFLKKIVAQEMIQRGLKQSQVSPDLKINIGVVLEEKSQTRQTSLADPGEWDYIGQRNYKWESQTIKVGTYKEGSLTIHLVDSTHEKALWIGMIEGIIPKNKQKRQKKIKEAVSDLFSRIDQSEENRPE